MRRDELQIRTIHIRNTGGPMTGTPAETAGFRNVIRKT